MRRWGDPLAFCEYNRGDELLFKPRDDFAEAFVAAGRRLPPGPKWSLVRREAADQTPDEVVGVAGLEEVGERRWAAWALLAPLQRRDWPCAVFFARELIKAYAAPGPKTFVAVPAPTPEAVRLLKRIGFVEVGEPYMVWEG